jgi:hypothetical protein
MRELRPELVSEYEFVRQVDQRQRPAGYRLVGSVPNDTAPALAVAGFRVGENLAWSRHLYIDDVHVAGSPPTGTRASAADLAAR